MMIMPAAGIHKGLNFVPAHVMVESSVSISLLVHGMIEVRVVVSYKHE